MPFSSARHRTIDDFKYETDIQPQVTRRQGIGAAFDLARMSTLSGYIHSGRPDKRGEEMLDPEYLNDLYPHLERPFTESVSADYARHVINRDIKRKELMDLMNRAPNDVLQGTMELGAGFLASMIDPYEVGIGMATGFALQAGVTAVRAGRLANMLTARTRDLSMMQQVQRSAAYNVAGSAAIEPALFVGAKQEHEQRTLGDAMVSIAASAIVGTALEVGLANSGRLMRDITSGEFGANLKVKMGLATMGKDINLDMPARNLGRRENLTVYPTSTPGVHLGNPTGGPIRGDSLNIGSISSDGTNLRPSGSFYTITSGSGESSRSVSFLSGDTPFSNAAHIWNDPTMALSGDNLGNVRLEQIDINSARVADIDAPISTMSPEIKDLVRREIRKGFDENKSLKANLDQVPTTRLNRLERQLEAQLRGEGFDGVSFKNKQGEVTYDGVALFDQGKIKTTGLYTVAPEFLQAKQNLKANKIREALKNKENDYFDDPSMRQTLDEQPTAPRAEDDVMPLPPVDEGRLDQIRNTINEKPELLPALNTYDTLRVEADALTSIVQRAQLCGGMG